MFRLRLLILALAAFGILAAPTLATKRPSNPYTLTAVALLGGHETDVYLTVSSSSVSAPDRIDWVQLRALPIDGRRVRTRIYVDVKAPGGVAVLHVRRLQRHQRLDIVAHVKLGPQNSAEATTEVLLRPDLTVTNVSAPTDVVRRQQLAVTATVTELAGDSGASATAMLLDGTQVLASQPVTSVAGGSTAISFATALGQAGRHDLQVVVSDAVPAEANVSNDQAARPVDVHMYTSDGVVSTDHWVATKVGEDVLRAGGNAVDAAAAIVFALNVVNPNLAGIGGGTAVVVRLANGDTWAIDGRELAPHAQTADEYAGKTAAAVGINGYAVGVPMTLRTVDEMLKRWGTMSLADVLQEPIALAENGAPVGQFLAAGSAEARTLDLQAETLAMFRPGGVPLKAGDTIVQPDLAKTFRLIAAQGEDVFYKGEIAQAIVDATKRLSPTKPIPGGEGRMTLADLANAHVRVEKPLSLDFHGATVLAPPPSTNGGLVLLEALGLYQKVEQANPAADWTWGSYAPVHTTIESLRLAFADRDMWIGDPDVADVPASGLLSDGYLTARSSLIHLNSRIANADLAAGDPRPFDAAVTVNDELPSEADGHTTHLAVIDKWGNAVALTTTVADTFGSGIMVPGYGFELNDSLNLFNLTPKANADTGNPGANDAAPDKRPMGSMTPTIVVKDGEPILVTGTYGSSFIPSLVFNVVTNVADFGMTLQQAVDAPRIWGAVANVAPPSANFARNPGFPRDDATFNELRAIGDQLAIKTTAGFGSTSSAGANAATLDLVGASDKRQVTDPAATVIARP
jgi:gamma-glutamyltranspeptidase / glutathione hydrolase